MLLFSIFSSNDKKAKTKKKQNYKIFSLKHNYLFLENLNK